MHNLWDINKLKTIVKESTSKAEILRKLGVRVHTYYYSRLAEDIKLYNLDTTHFIHKGKVTSSKSLSEILIENITLGSHALKLRLIKEKLVKNTCVICRNI